MLTWLRQLTVEDAHEGGQDTRAFSVTCDFHGVLRKLRQLKDLGIPLQEHRTILHQVPAANLQSLVLKAVCHVGRKYAVRLLRRCTALTRLELHVVSPVTSLIRVTRGTASAKPEKLWRQWHRSLL